MATTVEEDNKNLPNYMFLSNPIPNPVKEEVGFKISISSSQSSEFIVYNSIGQKVYSTALNEDTRHIILKVDGWEPGVYFCVFKTSEGVQTRKMIKL